MNKSKKTARSLTLGKETLRTLNEESLSRVGGGEQGLIMKVIAKISLGCGSSDVSGPNSGSIRGVY